MRPLVSCYNDKIIIFHNDINRNCVYIYLNKISFVSSHYYFFGEIILKRHSDNPYILMNMCMNYSHIFYKHVYTDLSKDKDKVACPFVPSYQCKSAHF